jgi:flavin-dependent dehydrogenase
MAERLASARRVTPVYGVSPRESFYRVPYGKGWVLVGDAAYYKDPLPGQGIHDALRSTELAANAFVEYRAGGETPQAWERAFRKYHSVRDRETKPMYDLTDYYAYLDRRRSPQEMDLLRALAAMPKWSDRYVSLFNGVTDVKWFRRFDTLTRILVEWRFRQLKQRLFGVRALPAARPYDSPTNVRGPTARDAR